MPRKLGGTDDFKPKKVQRIGDYRPGNRFSFRVPGNKPKPDTECGKVEIPKRPPNLNPNSNVGRPDGYAVLYSPEQIENYKKQYPRFEAALNLVPDGIHTADDGTQVYSYCSKNSPTGYWKVTLTPNGGVGVDYYIDCGDPLFILCPVPFKIDQIDSNGDRFIWTQLEGGRLAFVDPDSTIDPVLHILDDVRDHRPIRFKVAIADEPEVNDTLIIYTTPTSDHHSISQTIEINSTDSSPLLKSIPQLAPAYLQRAYFDSSNLLGITWKQPSINAEYVTGYEIRVNRTGNYELEQSFTKESNPLFLGEFNTHYRLVTYFNIHGIRKTSISDHLYISSSQNIVFADDSARPISCAQLNTSIQKLPISRKSLDSADVHNNISFTQLNTSIQKLPIGRSSVDSVDTYNSSSFTQNQATITKYNIGGVIIS